MVVLAVQKVVPAALVPSRAAAMPVTMAAAEVPAKAVRRRRRRQRWQVPPRWRQQWISSSQPIFSWWIGALDALQVFPPEALAGSPSVSPASSPAYSYSKETGCLAAVSPSSFLGHRPLSGMLYYDYLARELTFSKQQHREKATSSATPPD
jgi:hypothetical protein